MDHLIIYIYAYTLLYIGTPQRPDTAVSDTDSGVCGCLT